MGLSEQIECLTQVAIQTLSAIAGNGNQSNNEQDMSNEMLLGYCDKAQETAETILTDIKAEIQLRNNVILNNNHKTPGGPNDYGSGNPFDIKRNQSTKITNVSAKSYKDHEIDDEEASNGNSVLFSSVM